jgi:hypothetical protein
MESEPMTPDDPTPLERLLREGLPAPEVPDDGFTERVICALPRGRGRARLPLSLAWLGTAAGLTPALLQLAASNGAAQAARTALGSAVALIGDPWMAFALLACLASYLYALHAARAAYSS